jgi:hypothetical protein
MFEVTEMSFSILVYMSSINVIIQQSQYIKNHLWTDIQIKGLNFQYVCFIEQVSKLTNPYYQLQYYATWSLQVESAILSTEISTVKSHDYEIKEGERDKTYLTLKIHKIPN